MPYARLWFEPDEQYALSTGRIGCDYVRREREGRRVRAVAVSRKANGRNRERRAWTAGWYVASSDTAKLPATVTSINECQDLSRKY